MIDLGLRRFSRAALLFAVVNCGVLPGSGVTRGDDWPAPRHDPQQSGRSASTLDPTTLQYSWSAPDNFRRPLVAGNQVFAHNGTAIASFDLSSGQELWRTPAADTSFDSGAVGGGVFAYVASGPVLKVLDAASGAFKYSVPLAGGTFNSQITLATDTTAQQPVAYLHGGGRVQAVRLGDAAGTLLWGATGILSGPDPVAVIGDSLIAATTDHYYRINRTTGAVTQFRSGNRSGGVFTPVADPARNRFYVLDDDGNLEAFGYDGAGGPITPLWSKSGPGIDDGIALDADGDLYSADRNLLVKIDSASGAIVDSEPGTFSGLSYPLVSDGYVWEFGYRAGGVDGRVHVHRTSDLSLARTVGYDDGAPHTAYTGRSAVAGNSFVFDLAEPGFAVFHGVPEPSATLLLAPAAAAAALLRRARARHACAIRGA